MNQVEIKSFEDIKAKIETLKSKKARAEGSIESIVGNWKARFNCSTLEEAQKYLADKKTEQHENEERIDTYYEELKGICNWNIV
jgi:hypothetical protein